MTRINSIMRYVCFPESGFDAKFQRVFVCKGASFVLQFHKLAPCTLAGKRTLILSKYSDVHVRRVNDCNFPRLYYQNDVLAFQHIKLISGLNSFKRGFINLSYVYTNLYLA